MKQSINNFSKVLCALMVCVGLVFSGCTEGPLEEVENTEQTDRTDTPDNGEGNSDQDVNVEPTLEVRKVKSITIRDGDNVEPEENISYTYDEYDRIIKVVNHRFAGTSNDQILTYDLTYQDDCVILVNALEFLDEYYSQDNYTSTEKFYLDAKGRVSQFEEYCVFAYDSDNFLSAITYNYNGDRTEYEYDMGKISKIIEVSKDGEDFNNQITSSWYINNYGILPISVDLNRILYGNELLLPDSAAMAEGLLNIGSYSYYIELGLYEEGGTTFSMSWSEYRPPYSYQITEKEEYYDTTDMIYEFDTKGYPVKLYCSAKTRKVREIKQIPLDGTQDDIQVETTYGEPQSQSITVLIEYVQ